MTKDQEKTVNAFRVLERSLLMKLERQKKSVDDTRAQLDAVEAQIAAILNS